MSRPLRSVPDCMLRAFLRFSMLRGLWTETVLEIHHRAGEEAYAAANAASNDETGPWPVSMPRGMH